MISEPVACRFCCVDGLSVPSGLSQMGSAPNGNLHFHVLVLDGVFTCPSPFTRAVFHTTAPLEDEEVEQLTCTLHRPPGD